nr:hypothetical protein [uncultured Brumimicrobium sp.]
MININIKFVDEFNNPVRSLPVAVGYSGAPMPIHQITDEKGLINVNLTRSNPFSKDSIFGCYFWVNYQDYEFLYETLEIANDTLIDGLTQTYKIQKIQPTKLNDALFDNLSGLISLSDFAIKDTIFLYQSYSMPIRESSRAMAHSSIKLVRLRKDIFKIDVYGSELTSNIYGWEDSFVINRTEKLIRINLKKRKIKIEIDGEKFKFFLHGLEVPTQNGNTYRYMLARIK